MALSNQNISDATLSNANLGPALPSPEWQLRYDIGLSECLDGVHLSGVTVEAINEIRASAGPDDTWREQLAWQALAAYAPATQYSEHSSGRLDN